MFRTLRIKDKREYYLNLPDKEEEVITVNAPVRLKEEVSDEEVCPVSCIPCAGEPGVLGNIGYFILEASLIFPTKEITVLILLQSHCYI